ncbi:MAG TPA: M67 family metallopeptidase [Coleofasciculaceae cyanobacterium]
MYNGELLFLHLFHRSVTLTLSAEQLRTIAAQAETAYPHECCGLLLGQVAVEGWLVTQVWPVPNDWDPQVAAEMGMDADLTSERRYWIAPQEMLAAIRHARSQGVEVIGVYHSHPNHPAVPSECDRQMAWPNYVYVIASLAAGKIDQIRAWGLDSQRRFNMIKILKIDSDSDQSEVTMGADGPVTLF